MSVKIQALDNGPFLVSGDVEIIDGEGKVLDKHESCHLCRCGLSDNPPYCTGAHQGKYENKVRK